MARAALLGLLLGPLLALLLPGAGARRYEYRKYSEHVRTMEELGRRHPTLIRVETAQKKYGLKAVGSCPGVPHEQCLQHILTLTNLTSLALETRSRVRSPPATPPRPPCVAAPWLNPSPPRLDRSGRRSSSAAPCTATSGSAPPLPSPPPSGS